MARRRENNNITTSRIEHEIAFARASKNAVMAAAWKQVASVVSAPIDESKIENERAAIETAMKADGLI